MEEVQIQCRFNDVGLEGQNVLRDRQSGLWDSCLLDEQFAVYLVSCTSADYNCSVSTAY